MKLKITIASRKIGLLAADEADAASFKTIKDNLTAEWAVVELIAPRGVFLTTANGEQIEIDHRLLTAASGLFDAVHIAGGTNAIVTLEAETKAVHSLNEAFKHCKPIAANVVAL